MNKTKIEWCDYTWSPITGCFGVNGKVCPYCYARGIVNRFKGGDITEQRTERIKRLEDGNVIYELSMSKNPYPYGFNPTFHRYRLDEPAKMKKPQNIFVCSMADMFGDYIPDEWIKAVFDACAAAPWHRFLFLTKNPGRYLKLAENSRLPYGENFWYGTTTMTEDTEYFLSKPSRFSDYYNAFVSIEPILGFFSEANALRRMPPAWTIVGAMTGAGAKKHKPEREWIDEIVHTCRHDRKPIFMKNSLKEIWGEPLIQEYPWEIKNE